MILNGIQRHTASHWIIILNMQSILVAGFLEELQHYAFLMVADSAGEKVSNLTYIL